MGVQADGTMPPEGLTFLHQAEHIWGAERHLQFLEPSLRARASVYTKPLMASLVPYLRENKAQKIALLASGDPMVFGLGRALAAYFPASYCAATQAWHAPFRILPTPGAFQLASAFLMWDPLACEHLSLLEEPPEAFRPYLYAGARWLVLCRDRTSPGLLARYLRDQGQADAFFAVLSDLGTPQQTQILGQAGGYPSDSVLTGSLHLCAVQLTGAGAFEPRFGLADSSFEHDGQLTRRAGRLLALAGLNPYPGALLYDLGAGCGGVSVEWARLGGRVLAFEHNARRVALCRRNVSKLAGIDSSRRIEIRHASYEEAWNTNVDGPGDNPGGPPDAIFIGGGLSMERLQRAHELLREGGRLVAHAVTLEGEACLQAAYRCWGGELTRLQTLHAEALSPTRTVWRPRLPLSHFVLEKKQNRENPCSMASA